MGRYHVTWYSMLCHWVSGSRCSTGFSALNMLGTTHVIWHHIPEDLNPQQNGCENLKCVDILHVEDTIHLRHDTVSQDNGILTFSRNVTPSSPRFSKSGLILEDYAAFKIILEECTSFKMLESDFLLTQLHIPEECSPPLHHCQNLKPQILCGVTRKSLYCCIL